MAHKKKKNQNKQTQLVKYKFIRYGRVIVDIIVYVLFILSVYHVLHRACILKYGDSDYTICKLEKTTYHNMGYGRNELFYVVGFYVNNKRYQTDESPPYGKECKIGDCYMLKYNIANPNICEIDWSSPATIEEFESVEKEYMFGNHDDKE